MKTKMWYDEFFKYRISAQGLVSSDVELFDATILVDIGHIKAGTIIDVVSIRLMQNLIEFFEISDSCFRMPIAGFEINISIGERIG